MAFAPGEIAQLKSGSPPLTIISVDGEMVKVLWFAEEVGEFRTQELPAIALDALEIEDFDLDEDEDEEDEDEDEN